MEYLQIVISKSTPKFQYCFYIKNDFFSVEIAHGAENDECNFIFNRNNTEIVIQDSIIKLIGSIKLNEIKTELIGLYKKNKKNTISIDCDDIDSISYTNQINYSGYFKYNMVFTTREAGIKSFDYPLIRSFNAQSDLHAFQLLLAHINNIYLYGGNEKKIFFNDMVVYEEYFIVNKKNTVFYGFKDSSNPINPEKLFEINTAEFIKVYNCFLEYLSD